MSNTNYDNPHTNTGKIVLIVLLVIALAVAAYFIFFNKNEPKPAEVPTVTDIVSDTGETVDNAVQEAEDTVTTP
ncbi:MAG: hypothetical protein GX171_08240 [Clostridiales bacterium]|jgi:flagellar basal body-associated protein FliL|nr:hypothetical protein [Clostridiales bacterium]